MPRRYRKFNDYLQELEAFVRENGHANVPVRSSPLGYWLNNQRLRARRGELKPERLATLRALGVPVPENRPTPRGEAASRIIDNLNTLVQAGERFGTLYADPPWQYDNGGTRAAASRHYGCMSLDALYAMPVNQLAADNAHLFLWTTHAHLPHAFGLMNAWGFEYRSCYVWCKPRIGLGNYWRLAHETLLLGIRGDAKRFGIHNWRSWEEWPAGRHSAKPESIRAPIEAASPGPYLELFGRRAAPGWTVLGNQIRRDLIDQIHLCADNDLHEPATLAAAGRSSTPDLVGL